MSNVIKLQLQHMNNIIRVMVEETVARKLWVERRAEEGDKCLRSRQ